METTRVQTRRTISSGRGLVEARPDADRLATQSSLGARDAFAMALWYGLVAGLAELVGELARRGIFGERAWLGRYQLNRHYLWMIPSSSLLVFAVCGLAVSAAAWLSPRRAARNSFWTLSFVASLTLLLMIHSLATFASLALAGGIATWSAPFLEARTGRIKRLVARSLPALAMAGVLLAALAFGREAWNESRAASGRPAAPAGAPNVLLIVLDATRADALTPYGARRDTTPHLAQLARKGVTFDHARATAPWTLPSHASMFTGRWPHEVHVGSKKPLDGTYPTLAECLRRQGYATGGFVANYAFGSTRYGLNRGFTHYEDRPISLDDLLGSSGLGKRLMPAVDLVRDGCSRLVKGEGWVNPVDPRYYTHVRSAAEINDSVLTWISRQQGKPFFAFLNYYDGHAPYIPPTTWKQHFGRVPENRDDYNMLRNWEQDWHAWNPNRRADIKAPNAREFDLARDSYDDCVAYMDDQIGRLLGALDRRGVLSNTLVIVTSDHGEAFGEHGLFCHYVSVHRPEIDVPLLISLANRIPQGTRVSEPVSLRSLPATVLELVGLGNRTPFPGRSLTRLWSPGASPIDGVPEDLVYSELEEMSVQALMSGTQVYIHHGDGVEQLFDIKDDPGEDNDLMGYPGRRPEAEPFRSRLARIRPDLSLVR